MKILIISENFYPHLTGSQVVLWNIANALSQRGHQIIVITSRIENTLEYEFINNIEIYRPFSSVDSVGQEKLATFSAISKRMTFAVKLYLYLRKFLQQKQVDIIYATAYVPTIPTTWLASKNGIPVVTHVGLLCGRDWFQMTNPIMATFNYLMEILVLRWGKHDAIRCASQQVGEKVQCYTKAMVYAIPSPINTGEISRAEKDSNSKDIRQELEIGKNEQFLLFVGSLVPAKNVDGLIRALTTLPIRFKLVIVGAGFQQGKINGLIRELGMESKVMLLGRKPHEETLSIMKSCDVLLLPSRVEIFPTVVIEALALGRPVIATRVGGVSEVKSPNLYLINNLDQINELLLAAIKPKPDDGILEYYSLDRIASEFETMLDKLVQQSLQDLRA